MFLLLFWRGWGGVLVGTVVGWDYLHRGSQMLNFCMLPFLPRGRLCENGFRCGDLVKSSRDRSLGRLCKACEWVWFGKFGSFCSQTVGHRLSLRLLAQILRIRHVISW